VAYGVIKVIASQTHTQILIQSGNVPYGSARILNPNDGVLYVARNRDCNGPAHGDWEWKVPSQSYAMLPGEQPGFSTLGLYYVDQSGGNRPGEITVYPSFQKLDDPAFVAIGRAQLTAQTTLDIATGSQPANPGTGFARLWIDGSNDLHILGSNNVDNLVLDSSNWQTFVTPAYVQGIITPAYIGATPLGSDLFGTVADGHVAVRNAGMIMAYDSVGTRRNVIQYWSDNVTYFNALASTSGAQFVFRTAANASLAILDGVGNLTLISNLMTNGPTHYFNANSGIYWTWNTGGYLQSSHSILNGGASYFFSANNGIYVTWDGTYLTHSHGVSAPYYNGTTAGYVFRLGNTINTSIYMDATGIGVTQIANGGTNPVLRFAVPNYGNRYFDLQPGTPASDMVTLGGSTPKLVATQFIITSSSYAFMQLGRNSSEIQATVHLYSSGNIYAVLDVSGATITNRSSRKMKEGIVPLDADDAMARVRNPRVHPVAFRWSWPEMQRRQALGPVPPGSLVPRNKHRIRRGGHGERGARSGQLRLGNG
jgi:hypothetical protein